MDRIKVQSTDINSIGYDEKSRTLEIEFHTGNVYQYSGVEIRLYNQLINASSKGSFFHRFIKDRFPTRKLR